ncbi:MAG: low affinity iron permease family protein [Bacteroidia bacterium]
MKEENTPKKKKNLFENFSAQVTRATGSTPAFIIALAIVIIWGCTGPFFNYSETWQLVINTGTTIITFLMVFLIQKGQNKDSLAIQLKLNELVASHELASNRLVDVEDLTEEELRVIRKYYAKLAELTTKDLNIHQTHSLDEAEAVHEMKTKARKQKRK